MTRVELVFSTDVFAALRKSPDEVAQEIRLAAAVYWYAQGRVSQGKAAEIAGMSRAEFIDALAASKVPVCQVSPAELDEELARG